MTEVLLGSIMVEDLIGRPEALLLWSKLTVTDGLGGSEKIDNRACCTAADVPREASRTTPTTVLARVGVRSRIVAVSESAAGGCSLSQGVTLTASSLLRRALRVAEPT